MHEDLHSSKERKNEREVMVGYYEIYFARKLHLYEQRAEGDSRTFSDFLNDENQIIDSFVNRMNEQGVALTTEVLKKDINDGVQQGGARFLAEYVYDIVKQVGMDEEEGGSDKKLLHVEPVEENLSQMEETEFGSKGKFLRMHVSSLYTLDDTNLKSALTKELHEIAELVAHEYVDVQAIVGISWLLDSPLAKRLGFTVLDPVKTEEDTLAQRGQILMADGTVNKERARMYIETGKLPYQVRFGYISREELLRRYLVMTPAGS